MLVQLSTPT